MGLDAGTHTFFNGKFTASAEAFAGALRNRNVMMSKVCVVPGWFEDTCTSTTTQDFQMKEAAIVHIDCDLYESAKTVLRFITPLLVEGTVLNFDDWFCFRGNPSLGEQRAFREWSLTMADWTFTEYQKEGPFCNSFIANRRS